MGAALLAATAGTALAGPLPYRAVAVAKPTSGSGVHDTDAYGPNQGAGVYFNSGGSIFGRQTIDDAGTVVFKGTNTATSPNNLGVWVNQWNGTAYANTNVAMSGGARPGGGTYGTTIFDSVLLHDAAGSNPESMTFRNNTSTTGGVFAGPVVGGPARVMQVPDSAPGTVGATYASVGNPVAMNQNGQIAITSTLSGGDVTASGVLANGSGIWVGTPGSMNLAIRQGTIYNVVDPTGNVRVGGVSGNTLCLSNAGFLGNVFLQGAVTTSGNNADSQAILSTRTGSVEMIMRANQPAPGASAGELYGLPNTSMAINNAGNVAFAVSNLHNAAGTITQAGSSLFSDIGGSMTLMARAGAPLPAVSNANGSEYSGATWGTSSNFTDMVMNHSGNLAFKANMAGTAVPGTNGEGIFIMSPSGGLTKVMRDSDPVPGATDGAKFGFNFGTGLQMNSAGQVVFENQLLAGTGITSANNQVLCFFDPLNNNSLGVIARKGDLWEVIPGSGNFQTISNITGASSGSLGASGGEDGRVVTLNDNGDVVFHLDFSDGESGVYVSHIPAPGTCVLLGLGSIFASRRRRA
jgi:hypothetical protein